MADEHDDLLNFEDEEFGDGTLNEDELLLSDEEIFDDQKEVPVIRKPIEQVSEEVTKTEVLPVRKPVESPSEELTKTEILANPPIPPQNEKKSEIITKEAEPVSIIKSKTDQEDVEFKQVIESSAKEAVKSESEEPIIAEPQPAHNEAPSAPQPHPHPHQPSYPMGPRQFRPRGGRGMPRWMNPNGPSAPVPFQPQQQRPLRPPQMGGPIPPPVGAVRPPLRPYPPQRAPFFMQQRPNNPPTRPPAMPPQSGQRFFFQNQPTSSPVPPPGQSPGYIATTINQPSMPRKVLINPNFKGGIEAVKSQLMKEHFSSSSSMSEEELLRKQLEFINSNKRSIEKRRHERSPSPNYRRSYSHSPSPPRNYRRRPFRPYERRKSMSDRDGTKSKEKDENQPEEDEETRAYRQKIETQRKQREELLRQKELRRKQQMEAKAKETEPLKPIVVTEKKIILTKKPRLDEKSTTPPIDEAPIPASLTTQRRILLKSGKGGSEGKIGIDGNEKRKLQKIIKAEN